MKTNLLLLITLSILIFPNMAKSQVKVQQTAGHDVLGEFAPEFAHLNDNILFGEVWSRNDLLSMRDRSIVTVVALMSQGLYLLMQHSMQAGLKHGLHSVWQKKYGLRMRTV